MTERIEDLPEWAYGHRIDEPANSVEDAILTILDQAADRDEDTILTAHRLALLSEATPSSDRHIARHRARGDCLTAGCEAIR
jgi:hypothetical protein